MGIPWGMPYADPWTRKNSLFVSLCGGDNVFPAPLDLQPTKYMNFLPLKFSIYNILCRRRLKKMPRRHSSVSRAFIYHGRSNEICGYALLTRKIYMTGIVLIFVYITRITDISTIWGSLRWFICAGQTFATTYVGAYGQTRDSDTPCVRGCMCSIRSVLTKIVSCK